METAVGRGTLVLADAVISQLRAQLGTAETARLVLPQQWRHARRPECHEQIVERTDDDGVFVQPCVVTALASRGNGPRTPHVLSVMTDLLLNRARLDVAAPTGDGDPMILVHGGWTDHRTVEIGFLEPRAAAYSFTFG